MKKMKKIMGIITGTCALFVLCSISVQAQENSISMGGALYSYDEKSAYDTTNGTKEMDIADGTEFGKLSIKGDIKSTGNKNGIASYECGGENVSFEYSLKDGLVSENVDVWHITDDSSKKINDINLGEKVETGAVVIQSSIDGETWVTDTIYTDIRGKKSTYTSDIYSTNEIQLLNGCYYRVFVAYKEEKRIKDNKVGFDDYDSAKKLEEYVFYIENSSVKKQKNTSPEYGEYTVFDEVVNTGKDNGYDIASAQALDIKDPHFGWSLGHFTVNGYTDESEINDNGNIVFLKNVGDEIALWFTLEQDIDALNGDSSLSISEDKKAYDKNYQIKETNFKRGTLIVIYTDEKGKKHQPVIYTDYLAACCRTGADTRVQIYEEGEYEVALNYEIKSTPRKVGNVEVVPQYTNYKTVFKFSIRNGNSIAFPKDIKTGSELKDGTLTKNGFVIDQANSKYLKIDVVAKDINVNSDGLISTDTRKNTVANSSGQYTKDGIYTISVTNKYVSEPTKKTIYVGTNKYITAIARNRYTVDDINNKIREGFTVEDDGTLTPPPTPEPTPTEEPVEEVVDVTEDSNTDENDKTTSEQTEPSKEENTSASEQNSVEKAALDDEISDDIDVANAAGEEQEVELETQESDTKSNGTSKWIVISFGLLGAGGATYYLRKGKKRNGEDSK